MLASVYSREYMCWAFHLFFPARPFMNQSISVHEIVSFFYSGDCFLISNHCPSVRTPPNSIKNGKTNGYA